MTTIRTIDGGIIEVFRGFETVHEEPDVVYTETPERYLEQRVKLHFADKPKSKVLLIVPQRYVWFKQTNVDIRYWGNLLPRGCQRLFSDDLCLIYTTQEQFELGTAYLQHVRERAFMWGAYGPAVELVRKVVHA